jgi:hypothetical protein
MIFTTRFAAAPHKILLRIFGKLLVVPRHVFVAFLNPRYEFYAVRSQSKLTMSSIKKVRLV